MKTEGHSADGHPPAGHSHSAHASEEPAWMKTPMLYTRLNDAGTAFEAERDLITVARGLDGGGSVAADEGKTFAPDKLATAKPTAHAAAAA